MSEEHKEEEKISDCRNDDIMSEVKSFIGHEKVLTCVLFYPQKKKLVSSSFDNSVRFWDYETGKCLKQVKVSLGDEMENWLIVWDDDENGNETFLSCGDSGNIIQWSLESMRKIKTLFSPSDVAISIHRILRLENEMVVCSDGYNGILILIDTLRGIILEKINETLETDLAPLIHSKKYKNMFYIGWNCSESIAQIKYDFKHLTSEKGDFSDKSLVVWKKFGFNSETFSTYVIYVREDKEILISCNYGRWIVFFDTTTQKGSSNNYFKVINWNEMFNSIELKTSCLLTSSVVYKNRKCLFGGDDGSLAVLCLEDYKIKFHRKVQSNMLRGVMISDFSRRKDVRVITWGDDGSSREFSFSKILKGDLEVGYEDLIERINYLLYDLMEDEENREFYEVFRVCVCDIPPFVFPKITMRLGIRLQ